MELPSYFVVGSVPVKAVPTEGGGMDVLAYDETTGEFRRAMQYLDAVFSHAGNIDVDRVSEAAFEKYVARLEERRLAKTR